MIKPGSSDEAWLKAAASAPPLRCMFHEPRTEVDLAGTLISQRRRSAVRVQDLSAGGALLRSGRVPAVGENVLLHRGVYCCRATVRWVAGARYGLQFAQTLGAEQLALLMQPLPEDRERTSPLLRILESMRDDVFGIR